MDKKRAEIQWDMVAYWVIAAIILVISFMAIMVFYGKGTAAIDFIKNLFKLGG